MLDTSLYLDKLWPFVIYFCHVGHALNSKTISFNSKLTARWISSFIVEDRQKLLFLYILIVIISSENKEAQTKLNIWMKIDFKYKTWLIESSCQIWLYQISLLFLFLVCSEAKFLLPHSRCQSCNYEASNKSKPQKGHYK